MAIAAKGNKTSSKLGMVVLGDIGTRKSELALESITLTKENGEKCKVLYIDIENGSIIDRLDRFEQQYGIDLDDLYIVYTQSFSEVLDYIKMASENEGFPLLDENGNETTEVVLDKNGEVFKPDFIIVDGASLLWDSRKKALIEVSKRRTEVRLKDKQIVGKKAQVMQETAKLEVADYQQLTFDSNELILSLVGSGKHWIVTSFAKEEEVVDENGGVDSFGNPKKIKTGKIINDSFKGLTRYAKTVLCLSVDEFGDVKGFIQGKDRTETFVQGTIIQEPHLKLWENVILKSKNTQPIVNNIEKCIAQDADNIMKKNTPKSMQTVKLSNNTSISVEDLIKEIKEQLAKDGVASRKEKISKLKENGFGNPEKEKDIDKLKGVLDLLKSL